MLKEINLDGIFIAPFAAYLFVALLIFIPLRHLFDRYAVQGMVWHRPLFDPIRVRNHSFTRWFDVLGGTKLCVFLF
jgi:hypothetical protein